MNILDFFKKLFSKEEGVALGVDIGSSAIKVVQLRKKGSSAVLETYGELSLGPYAKTDIGRATNLGEPQIAEALADVLRESKVSVRECGMSIPFSQSLVGIIEVPALEGAELERIVPIEARKYVPVPITEVTLDWFILPKAPRVVMKTAQAGNAPSIRTEPEGDRQRTSDILIAAINNNALHRFSSVARGAKIAPSFFEIEIFSSVRSVLSEESVAMIFDLGAALTKLYIVADGVVQISHSINRGSQDLTLAIAQSMGMSVPQAEKLKRNEGLTTRDSNRNLYEILSLVLIQIFLEAKNVLTDYERKSGKRVEKMIFTGGGTLLKGLLPVAQASFDTAVELANPFKRVQAPAFLEGTLQEIGPEFAVAIGVAMRRLEEFG